MKIQFTKMSGAGNDFVVVDNRNGIISNRSGFTQTVSHRRFGIGADGTLLLENSPKADFLMRYYNADGTDAGMCGNGGRCIAKFAYDNGIVTKEKFTFEAFDYIYEATRIDSTEYELKMKNPFDFHLNQTIQLKGKLLNGNYINTGTDHAIIFTEDNPELGNLDSLDVFKFGKEIRHHQLYQPKGTNVNFVSKIGGNTIQIRTYERGVEDETLSCGTGSVAAALLSTIKFGLTNPVKVLTRSGDYLEIGFSSKGDNVFENITLIGPAEAVFTGNIDVKNAV